MTKLSAGVQEKLRQLRVAAGTHQPLTSGNHTEAATAAGSSWHSPTTDLKYPHDSSGTCILTQCLGEFSTRKTDCFII